MGKAGLSRAALVYRVGVAVRRPQPSGTGEGWEGDTQHLVELSDVTKCHGGYWDLGRESKCHTGALNQTYWEPAWLQEVLSGWLGCFRRPRKGLAYGAHAVSKIVRLNISLRP